MGTSAIGDWGKYEVLLLTFQGGITDALITCLYKERLDEMVELFNVERLIYTQVKRLSLGERMKMEIISSLLHGPKVVFMDEPTIGLDVI